MKIPMLRSCSLLGLALMMTLSAGAQDQPKVKVNDNEFKYKSDDVKIKANGEEAKYKSDDLKIKENDDEVKIKGKVRPVRPSTSVRTEMKTGQTQVMTKEHLTPLTAEPDAPATTPAAPQPVAVPKTAAAVNSAAPRKTATSKGATRNRTAAARRAGAAPRTIVKTKIVRDTVFVPSPPERIVSTQTEYVRDTVLVTRVDTVVKVQTTNTSSGYQIPAGDFKKVKLKKDKDGEVHMKRKE